MALATFSVADSRASAQQDPLPLKAVKNGFIHFYSPVAVVAQERHVGMSRSSSWPALPEADATSLEEPLGTKAVDAPAPSEGAMDLVPSTPSTTCPSHWSAGSPCANSRHVDDLAAGAAPAACETSRSSQTGGRPAPFASLMLPAWAVELAAKAPVEQDFDDLRSWYSASPCSTPLASPRAPIRVVADAACVAPCKARWADLADEEGDASDVWSAFGSSCEGEGSSFASVQTTCPEDAQSRPRWADMSDDED